VSRPTERPESQSITVILPVQNTFFIQPTQLCLYPKPHLGAPLRGEGKEIWLQMLDNGQQRRSWM
jgi:hypothetical protein